MAAWHSGSIEGAISSDEVVTLREFVLVGGQKELEADKAIIQNCFEGASSPDGKVLMFTLSYLNDGRTLVELTNGKWQEAIRIRKASWLDAARDCCA